MKKWNKERFATIWEKLESMIALRSLRARIFLLTLVIGLVPCIAMRHGIVSNYEDLAVEQRTTVVQNQLMILANHLISNNYLSSHGVREDTGNSREVINAVKEGFSDETISVPDYVETVHIVDAFNQLLKRMKALDDSRQEFVANVSHELKTPLTSIKVLSDSC